MAKITPSSLITAIQGAFNGDTFQLWKGAIIRRRTGKVRVGTVASKARFKGIVSEIAGKWAGLSASDKTSWDLYATFLPTSMSGFNAFISRNSALVYSGHPALCYFTVACACYYFPSTPSPFCVSWISGDLNFCVQWTTPALVSQFGQVYICPRVGKTTVKHPAFRLAKTVVSSDKVTTVDGSLYPAGISLYFRIKTIDVYGQVSSFSNTITCERT